MEKLVFEPVSIDKLNRLYPFTSLYGEGSCQHSAVSMYSFYDKYGDEVCIDGDFLYVLRRNLCDEKYRIYLAPFGAGSLDKAYERILSDAHNHGKKAGFVTLTKKHKDFLEKNYPGCFVIEEDRNMAEYVYSENNMAEFPGKYYERRRTEIRSYWRDYGAVTKVNPMTGNDLDEVSSFAEEWLRSNVTADNEVVLITEKRCIQRQLDSFDELGLSGTVIRIDGVIKAFCYGTALNDDYYDVLIEKGSRKYPGIYRVLRQESTKLNASSFLFINFEEDVGDMGLREIKESYGPVFMIEKYRVKEK
ncbi:DUF2156 domain-containing protein [Butyrivibrio sp. YAB3001]|uniref:DUF2156 domain-containing protein n=1 Tax=Butyrivibrio sp. YAB3001 TaxID=1520812 RepID=UPI0008F61DDB|nr:phosphatidylglycerol lysyltransferase domain-containing protein [Butyrivibrio sp. YAB3001]SFD05448.1 Uncharacterized conserved protein [Butyrivibrio sp. YAB3001]